MLAIPPDQHSGVFQQRYKRRRDGCQTCRTRRVKCGGEKPTCGHCQRLVLHCHWPAPIDADVDGARSKRQRNAHASSPFRRSPAVVSEVRSINKTGSASEESGETVVPQYGHQSKHNLSEPFGPSSIWHQYPQMEDGPTSGSPSCPATSTSDLPTSGSLRSNHEHSTALRDTLDPSVTLTEAEKTNRSVGLSLFSPNPLEESGLFGSDSDLLSFQSRSNNPISAISADVQAIPAFEDTFNFDLLFGLDQPVLYSSSAQSTTPRNPYGAFEIPNFDSWTQETSNEAEQDHMRQQSRLCSPVTLESSDQPIITYFLGTVAKAAITRYHNTSNYFVSLFSASLFCPALYHGMLAWSALHMAVGMMPSETRQAELKTYAAKRHALCADNLFPNLENVDFDNQGELEALYCALMVYGQYKVVSCASACQVRRVVDAIDGLHQRRGFFGSSSPLIQRMVSILAQYDMRSSLFGMNEPRFTLKLGSRVFEPQGSPSILLTGALGTASVLHMHYLDAKAADFERQIRKARSKDDVDAVRRTLRAADELYERVIHLDRLLDPESLRGFGHFDWSTIVDTVDFAGTKGALSQDVRHEIILACHYHGVVLNITRILNYPAPTQSVDRIIGLTLDLTIRHTEGVHGILAIPMFFAAVECRNQNQFESALKWFELSNGAVFGTLGKSRDLLLEVRQSQSSGVRIDIGKVMMRPEYDFLM